MDNELDIVKKYEEIRKRDKIHKIILIIIIIVLLLLWLVSFKIGKIGYDTEKKPNIPVVDNEDKNDEYPTIKVSDNETDFSENTDIDIFSNIKFNGESKIAPQSKGEYHFVINNVSKYKLLYNIDFTDKMSNKINMKYRLKIDNVYIKGNDESYVTIDELNLDDILVLADSNNVFTIEWYWDDSNVEDTYVGSLESEQYYTLEVKVQAEIYEK